jgi:protein gp37
MSSTTTGIEWTNATWNPMTGCTKISTGCDHCYAAVLAHTKTRKNYLGHDPVKDTPANRADPFAPRFWEERLDQPLRWRTPMRIFVNSMSDVFHGHFTKDMIRRVFEVMVAADWHDFQVLTKRPERALRLAPELPWADNIWIGTSIESMEVARRLDALKQITQAPVLFVSAEPLLGDVSALDFRGIQWVIGGGESGGGYRAVDPAWARSLRDRCRQQRVAFLWKQWGGANSKSGGRELDGRFHDQYPRVHPVERDARRPLAAAG